MLTIESKQFGRNQFTLSNEFNYPENWESPISLHDLLNYLVQEEVAAFQQRQTERITAVPILTAEEIAEGVERGKIGRNDHPLQEVNVDKAVARAIEAFQDGLFFVFVDGQQIENLAQLIAVTPTSTITFLRLIALVGG